MCRMGGLQWSCLVKGVVAPLPGLASHIEVHICGTATSAVGLHAAAPLALEVLQPRQCASWRGLHRFHAISLQTSFCVL